MKTWYASISHRACESECPFSGEVELLEIPVKGGVVMEPLRYRCAVTGAWLTAEYWASDRDTSQSS